MKIAAAICILACVVAAVQAADAPAHCKDETAYLNKWTYPGDNADCKKYLACPIQHEKNGPGKKAMQKIEVLRPNHGYVFKHLQVSETTRKNGPGKKAMQKIEVLRPNHGYVFKHLQVSETDDEKKAATDKAAAIKAAEDKYT